MSTDVTTEQDANEPEEAAENGSRFNLSIDVSDIGPCLKHVRITVPRADIDNCYEEIIEELKDTAQVPGFRSGHAPKELVQRRYKDELDAQVKQKVLFDSLEQMSEEQDFEPINEPDLDVASLEIPEEGDFEYEFDVEVRPEFKLPDFTGIEIEEYSTEVSDEQIDGAIERYISRHGQLVPHEGKAEAGDYVTLSAKFLRDGKEINDIDEFTARLRPVLRFRDAELTDFDKLFEGEEIDAVKEVELKVSPEAEKIELRGETVTAKFTLLDLKRLELPELNDDLLEKMGVESEDELRKNIRDSFERQAMYQQRQHTRDQVMNQLAESANWDLPEKLVTRQTENAMRREMLEMQQAGYSPAEIHARENELRQNAISETRDALKQHFILDRIAEENEIIVGDEEIEQEMMLMALQSGESPRRVRAKLQKNGMIENLAAQLRERKAVDWLIGKAKMKSVPAPAQDVDRIEAVSYSVCGMVDPAPVDAGEESEEE
ncbi:trigger factor [Calycomorphotria hydatis]|nr:trigger factor [Calycomorphotria hydatis]